MDDTVIGQNGNPGEAGVPPDVNGTLGETGGDAVAAAAAPGDPTNTAQATGGRGGSGGDGAAPDGLGGSGGTGGNASATAVGTDSGAGRTQATAIATGGQGGAGGGSGGAGSGTAGQGGTASGQATAVNLAGAADASVVVTGGAGGDAGAYGTAGDGGAVTGATASAEGGSTASASVTATAGNGGSTALYGTGGNGTSESLSNAVSGTTLGGSLTLSQTAIGGNGGATGYLPNNGGTGYVGSGGDAASSLTLDDASSTSPSQEVTVTVDAIGGDGGVGNAAYDGFGGNAVATAQVTGAQLVNVTAEAHAGVGDYFGTAIAQAVATGPTANSTAIAVDESANYYLGGPGPVQAVATSIGSAGTAAALAQFSSTYGSINASASAPVLGTTTAKSVASFASTLVLDTAEQAVAFGFIDPIGTDNDLPRYYSVDFAAELGGGPQASDGITVTSTADIGATLLTNNYADPDLLIDLHGATVVGTGVTGVDVTMTAGTETVLDMHFDTGTAAQAFFTDHVLDVGPLSEIEQQYGTLDLSMAMSVTTDDATSGFYAEIETGLPCYCRGTMILTPAGEVAVERLRIGDLVNTHAGAARAIKWIGRRAYDARFIAGRGDMLPIRFHAGSLGSNLPHRDLLVSPHHAMLIDGVLVPAELLVNGVTITAERDVAQLEYFHIELETHDILIAEGAPAESFVDCDSRFMFQNAAEFSALYPEADPPRWQRCAPLVEDGPALAAIQRLLAPADDARCGALRGHVDAIADGFASGWARDGAEPVGLVLEIDGQQAGRAVANHYRADLEQAGMSGGRHGFRIRLPRLDRARNHLLRIRREADGAELDGSPLLLPRLLHQEWRGADAQSLIAAADRLSRSA